MKSFKQWFNIVTFGQTSKYLKLTLWMFLDTFAASIPYGVMMTAIYIFLGPVMHPGQQMYINYLWVLTGVLVLQTIAYGFIRKKTYMDICVGYSSATKTARLQMAEHLKTLSMGFFSQRDAGDLSNVMLRDFDQLESMAQGLIPQLSVIFVRLIIAIIAFAIFDWRMLLSLIVVIPIALPFAFLSLKRMTHDSEDVLETQQKTTSLVYEYVGGIETLRAYNQSGSKFSSLKNQFEHLKVASKNQEKAGGPVSMFGRAILFCGIGIVMGVGAYLLTQNKINPFYYICFLLVSIDIYGPIMQIFTFIATYAAMNKSVERIDELNNTSALEEASSPSKTSSASIKFDNVSFGYNKKEVLHNLSFEVPEKSLLALVGPSGSGKSTVTRLIARFWDANSGKIYIGGVPLKDLSSEDLMSKISIVFQDVYLFNDTIEENIRMGKPDATLEEIKAAAKKAACDDFIESLPDGYKTVVGEGGSTLSGGEKQRISIARALLKNAPIVLLDEATASLDPRNEVQIQRAINELVQNKTVIVIAHRLQSIMSADNIIVLKEGKIEEQGTHAQLLAKKGLYSNLWEEQNKAGVWSLAK